jgi:hypothetical protein
MPTLRNLVGSCSLIFGKTYLTQVVSVSASVHTPLTQGGDPQWPGGMSDLVGDVKDNHTDDLGFMLRVVRSSLVIQGLGCVLLTNASQDGL